MERALERPAQLQRGERVSWEEPRRSVAISDIDPRGRMYRRL
jgi:hypothetical protein